MSESVPESKPASVAEPGEDPWHAAFIEFKTRDEKMAKDYQEEIDTLLVFAGLFSAVQSAFLVQSNQSLQEDYTQTSAHLLRHISHQLANSSLPAAHMHDPSLFQPQPSDVQVNMLWFVSLVLSLVAALFGIFLKQWMRAYMKWTDVTPEREAVALRHFRYGGLRSWGIETMLSLLPTILQVSVIFFLQGLVYYSFTLDGSVGMVLLSLTYILIGILLLLTLIPLLKRICPYRSPLPEALWMVFWRVSEHLSVFIGAIWDFYQLRRMSPSASYGEVLADKWRWQRKPRTSWVQADQDQIARYNCNNDRVSTYVSAMVHMCCTTQFEPLWSRAITAIVTEHNSGSPIISSEHGDAYLKEIWWPMLGHIVSLHEEDLPAARSNGLHTLVHQMSERVERFSLSMQHSWLSFLLCSKSHVCHSHSSRMVVSYLLCCLASRDTTIGGRCMLAFMEVLQAQHAKIEDTHLYDLARVLFWVEHYDNRTVSILWDPEADAKWVEITKSVCDQAKVKPILNKGYRLLLDVLVQLACQIAITITEEPHELVPEDLKNVLLALQQASDDSYVGSYQCFFLIQRCAPALIFVARREPDLFPKLFARAIVHKLNPVQLWNIVCGVDGLDVEGIDVARITNDSSGRDYMWESLNARTPNATELLIAPQPFGQILDSYERQVQSTRFANTRQ